MRIAPSLLASAILACAAAGCGPRARAPEVTAAPASDPFTMGGDPARPVLRFAFEGVDGRPISTEAFANRITVIGFFTTYDVNSQAEARLLASLVKRHTPRINAAALMLEPPENKPLVEAFVASMGLPYPVALADKATIAGEGPFAGLHYVPSVVILDREGREAFRRAGFLHEAALEAAVRAVEKRER